MSTQEDKTTKNKVPRVFDLGDRQCLWASAGLIEPKLCHNAFDCAGCAFDTAMQRQKSLGWLTGNFEKPPQGGSLGSSRPLWPQITPDEFQCRIGTFDLDFQRHKCMGGLAMGLEQPTRNGGLWNKQRWLQTPEGQRWCRHTLSGRATAKTCDRFYECGSCELDQMIKDIPSPLASESLPVVYAAGFEVPPSYYFHAGHTWARLEYGGRVRVGLDDLASRVFGPADEFRLPELGEEVRYGAPELGFSRGSHQGRALSPVEGVVVARNPAASRQAPDMCRSPYLAGWLLLIKPAHMQVDLPSLHTGDESVTWMVEESQRLSDTITGKGGRRLAATGGRVVPDVFGSVPGLDWDNLARKFLLS